MQSNVGSFTGPKVTGLILSVTEIKETSEEGIPYAPDAVCMKYLTCVPFYIK